MNLIIRSHLDLREVLEWPWPLLSRLMYTPILLQCCTRRHRDCFALLCCTAFLSSNGVPVPCSLCNSVLYINAGLCITSCMYRPWVRCKLRLEVRRTILTLMENTTPKIAHTTAGIFTRMEHNQRRIKEMIRCLESVCWLPCVCLVLTLTAWRAKLCSWSVFMTVLVCV